MKNNTKKAFQVMFSLLLTSALSIGGTILFFKAMYASGLHFWWIEPFIFLGSIPCWGWLYYGIRYEKDVRLRSASKLGTIVMGLTSVVSIMYFLDKTNFGSAFAREDMLQGILSLVACVASGFILAFGLPDMELKSETETSSSIQ